MNYSLYSAIILSILFLSCSTSDNLDINNNDFSNKSLDNVKKIIFIYNASDDLLSVSFDFIHKIASPSTYQCSLCKVTYGNFRMHQEWKNYITSVPFEIEFLYKNNYLDYHENLMAEEFPVAYKYDGNSYEVFISKNEFDLCDNLDDLINLMNRKAIK